MSKKNTLLKVKPETFGFCDDGWDCWKQAFGKKRSVELTYQNVEKFLNTDKNKCDLGYDLRVAINYIADYVLGGNDLIETTLWREADSQEKQAQILIDFANLVNKYKKPNLLLS
jgi:hypothetical protein